MIILFLFLPLQGYGFTLKMKEHFLRYVVKLNHWRKRHLSQGGFLILAAAIVGALGGLAASILKWLTHTMADFLQNDFQWDYKYILYFFFPLIGIFLTLLYLKVFIRKRPFHHGIPPLLKSISEKRSRLAFHNAYSQIISSALTVGLGGSAGLEAPAVASGAAIGSNTAGIFGLSYREHTLLLACGGAAGIAGAFNSPIAGMVFAIEVLLPAFNLNSVIPLLIASAVASVVSRLLNSEPLFILVTHTWQISAFWFYVVFALIAGFYSVFFGKLNAYIHKSFARIKNRYNKVWIGGLLLGSIIAIFPAVYGEGYITIQKLLDGNFHSLLGSSLFLGFEGYSWFLVGFAALTLLGKTVGCIVTMSSGGNGGMFGPSVVVGGLLGFVFAYAVNQTGMAHLNVTHFMIAGMAASISGVMHAPLTGVFLSAEITGGYVLIVPLMLVAAIAYFVNKGFLNYSIYTKELAEGGELTTHENMDYSVLTHLKLKYLIEKDFVILRPTDSAASRRQDIIHAQRNVFPVVDKEGKLMGVLTVERLLEKLLNKDKEVQNQKLEQFVQPADEVLPVDTRMRNALQLMDKIHTRILPVVDHQNNYLGFVTKNNIFTKYRKLLIRQNDML